MTLDGKSLLGDLGLSSMDSLLLSLEWVQTANQSLLQPGALCSCPAPHPSCSPHP